jgi:hypothetical protein
MNRRVFLLTALNGIALMTAPKVLAHQTGNSSDVWNGMSQYEGYVRDTCKNRL